MVSKTSIVQEVVCGLTLRTTTVFIECIVTHVLQLNGLGTISQCVAILLDKAGLDRGSLPSHNDLFDLLGERLLRLNRVETLSLISVFVLESMQKVSIIAISSLHRLPVELIVIHHDR